MGNETLNQLLKGVLLSRLPDIEEGAKWKLLVRRLKRR